MAGTRRDSRERNAGLRSTRSLHCGEVVELVAPDAAVGLLGASAQPVEGFG